MATSQPKSTVKGLFLMKLRAGPKSTTALIDYAGFKDGIAEPALKQLAEEGLIEGDDDQWIITPQGTAQVAVMATAIYEAVMKADPSD